MSFKPYPKYKESGVEWLGRVPEHWEVARLKYVVAQLSTGGTPDTTTTRFWAEGDEGGVPWVSIGDMSREPVVRTTEKRLTSEGIASKRLDVLPTGTLLFSMFASLGKVASLGVPAAINQAILGITPNDCHVSGAFLRYWLTFLQSHVDQFSSSNTQDNLNAGKVRNFPIVVASLSEQSRITSFLDHETAKIDALIAEQQRLIELLQEKRQAVISHAVTKGLNPDAPMKDSGIEWLGEVPEHWEVMRIRHLVQQDRRVTYGIVQPGEPQPDGTFMVRGKDYSDGWCDPAEIFRVSSAIEVPYARSRIRTGDLVMTIVGAGVGNVAVVPEWLDGANITQTTARIALDASKAWPDYVCGAFQGIVGKRNLDCFVYGSAQPRLNIEHVDSYAMAVPPIDEQKAIARWVTDHGKGFDQLAAESKMSIALLQERRSALISAAVTGQIDVRDFAPDGGSEAA